MLSITNYSRNAIKTTLMYHLTAVRIAIIKKFTNNQCWRECGEKGTLLHCWWKQIGIASMNNSMKDPQETRNGVAI